jgi:hypothetical protein
MNLKGRGWKRLKIAVFWVVAPCSCYNPEDSNLHTHRRENLKSYMEEVVTFCKLLSQCLLGETPRFTKMAVMIDYLWIDNRTRDFLNTK